MIPALIGALAGAVGGFAVSKIISKDDVFYTTKDASEILGISEYTVRKKIREKDIRAEVIPGKSGFRIKKSDLEEYQGRKKNSKSADFEPEPQMEESNFASLTTQLVESILSDSENGAVSQEFLQNVIEGRQLDLKGLQLRMKQLELDADDSIEFKRKKIALEIAINDLEAEIQAYQTVTIAARDLKNFKAKKSLEVS